MAESRTIGVFGAGWVGLVTGGCFAELGHSVIVRDVVPDRIVALQAGRLPFHEPDLPEVLVRNRDRIRYTLDADGAAVEVLYGGIEAPVVRTDVASAEMIKLAANAFLMTRISFINEIANVCEAVGADVVEVAKGIGLDHRLGPHFLRAGIGYGGSCFPKDSLALKQLASNSGYHFQLLAAVIEVNELQKRRVIQKLQKHLGRLRGKKVALLGLAFKAGTDDMREAPSLVLASRLLAEGAEVRAWDPVARPGELMKGAVLCASVHEAVSGTEAAVIVTEWDELRGLASAEVRDAMARPLIIDGRNLLDPEETRRAGFAYEGIGRQSSGFEALPETAEPEQQVTS